MKTKKTMIAALMLALFALTVYADEKTDAFIEAVQKNNIAEVRRLIADGVDVNATNDYNVTELMIAVALKCTDVARL